MDQKNYKTKWLKFYVYIWLPLLLIVGGIRLYFGLSDASDYSYVRGYSIGYNVGLFAYFLFVFIVFINMLKMTEKGYRLNRIFLFVYSIGGILSALSTAQEDLFLFAVFVLFYVVWLYSNLVYFKHRRFLFHDKMNVDLPLSKNTPNAAGGIQSPSPNNPYNPLDDNRKIDGTGEESNAQENRIRVRLKKSESSPSLQSNTCAKCGTQLSEGDRFCSNCGHQAGTTVPRPKYCRYCGSILPEGFKYCNKCGHEIGVL